MSIKELVDRIIADGKLTESENQQLQDAINADGKIDAEENEQVARVLGMIASGQLDVV
jgi:hypothetical protein